MGTQSVRKNAQYLTHKFASAHGCTTGEFFFIVAVCVVIEVPFILLGAFFLQRYLGFLGAVMLGALFVCVPSLFVLPKIIAKYIGTLRKGRPYGYLTLIIRKSSMLKALGYRAPYQTHQGQWINKRGRHV